MLPQQRGGTSSIPTFSNTASEVVDVHSGSVRVLGQGASDSSMRTIEIEIRKM
jgi:hypothetical protein